MDNNIIKLKILGITFSQVQAGAYALILKEENGLRRLPIIIGTPEAQSIAIHLEGLVPPRPLTHDLFVTFTQLINVEIVAANIYKYEEGIFFSELLFKCNGKELCIDSRTSDAIAVAIRSNAPIYITETIMHEVSVEMEEDGFGEWENPASEKENDYNTNMDEELQRKLNEAIAAEDYEKASFLRDMLNNKK